MYKTIFTTYMAHRNYAVLSAESFHFNFQEDNPIFQANLRTY